MSSDKLRIIPLGGLGEIGRNMLVVEYDESLIIIDAGLMFPENDMLGIDIVIPDLQLCARARRPGQGHHHHPRPRGPHRARCPTCWQQVKAPVYATRLTRGLIEVKLREAHSHAMRTCAPSRPATCSTLAPLRSSSFTSATASRMAWAWRIHTPVGLVVHSGDFKFDHSPVDGQRTDFAKLAELGGRGVLLLLSDSTNAETPGYTPSEQVHRGDLRAHLCRRPRGA